MEVRTLVSHSNSTTTILPANAVFTGSGELTTSYADVQVVWIADVAPTSVQIQFSTDDENWDIVRSYTTTQDSSGLWIGTAKITPLAKHFRVVYTNGASNQTAFRLQTLFNIFSSPGLIENQNDFLLDIASELRSDYLQFNKDSKNTIGASFTSISGGFGAGVVHTFLQTANPIRIKAGGNAADDGNMSGTLTLTGIILNDETVTIGTRVYKFQDELTNVDGNIQIASTKSSLTLSFTDNAIDNETVVIDGKTYTFKASLTNVDGYVQQGDTTEESIDNLVACINLASGAGVTYAAATTAGSTTASKTSSTTMLTTARISGVAGDAIAVSETLTNASWPGGNLTGGADDTEGTLDRLVAAIDLSGAAGTDYATNMTAHYANVTPYSLVVADGAGTTVDVTCKILALVTTETLTNGSWAATSLAGGAGARSVVVTYLNSTWDIVIEEIHTSGASASANLSQDAMRILDMEVGVVGTYGVANTGQITLEYVTVAADAAHILAGEGKAALDYFTIPNGYTGYVKDFTVNVENTNSANFKMYKRTNGDYKQSVLLINDLKDITKTVDIPFNLYDVFPAKTDIWSTAQKDTGGGASTDISIRYSILLRKNL